VAKKQSAAPDLSEEALLWNQGGAFVFGVDEAGRGCLAGPVCAAVTCWPINRDGVLPVPVKDSKQMTESQREAVFEPILKRAMAHGIGFASSTEIDQWNILRATHLAVARALERALASLVNDGLVSIGFLESRRFMFLSDGNRPLVSEARPFLLHPDYAPEFPLLRELFMDHFHEKCIIAGDSKVFSIASASVLAKVSRDRLMMELDRQFPDYLFAKHKGYSTALHIEKLNKAGPCSEHRFSFAPVNEAFQLRNEA
jgi:ribonuclease HII